MMQITAELSTLNEAQRKAIAAFILNFPTISTESEPDPEGDENVIEIPAFTVHSEPEAAASPDEAFSAPVPPPPPPAPGPVLVPAPPADSATTLDKSGLPWDERIHASSRSLLADGSWRKKRGVSDALVAEVEAQLRSLMALPSPAATTEPTQVVPPPPPPSPTVAAVVPTPAALPSAPAATVDSKSAYISLISKASAAILAKQITQDQVNAAVISAGVPSLPLLGNRLDLVPQVAATIETLIAANAATA